MRCAFARFRVGPWQTPHKEISSYPVSLLEILMLQPHLVPVDLPVRKVLEHRGRRITNVYFPDRAGPPVSAPNRKGFGSRLIERAFAA